MPFGLLGPLIGLLEGPIFSIIDKLIPDPALKAKLKAEIEAKTIAHKDEVIRAQREILLQEVSQGSLLTRSWRPILMYLIMLFLLIYGVILPVFDLFTEKPVVFNPRWQEVPDGLWDLLGLGLGGYIGGRSLEKIAVSVSNKGNKTRDSGHKNWRRRANFRASS